MYRRDSNLSTSSFMDDVEMAHDEVFGGPMAESVPTSRSSFAHRRDRADSNASFTYYQEEEGDAELLRSSEDDSAILDDEDDIPYEEDSSLDLEAGDQIELRRSSSGHSRRDSVHDRLLRNDSSRTYGSNTERGHRTNHKIYITSEDLTIVVAGFRTNSLGFALYTAICVISLGLGYLLLRWLPRWKVRIIGSSCPLRECTWVVLEVSFTCCFFQALRDIALALSNFHECDTDCYRTNGESLLFKMWNVKSTTGRSPPSLDPQGRNTYSHTMTTMTQFLSIFAF